MSKHRDSTHPDGTPAGELIEQAREETKRRHPAGRRFVTSGLLAVGILAAVPAGIASARPVSDSPAGPYCGPGMVYVSGYGCARTVLPPDRSTHSGGLFAAIATSYLPAFLIF